MLSGSRKVLKTIGMLGLCVCSGIVATITGPTLVDLMYLYKTNYESVSIGAALRGFGVIPGSLVAGYIETKYPTKKDWMITLSSVIGVVATLASCYAGYLIFFWILWFLAGICLGVFFTVDAHVIKELWEGKFSLYWNIMIFGYSVGGFVTPLIVNPFLMNQDTAWGTSNTTQENVTNVADATPSYVQYAYIVCCLSCVVLGIPWFLFCIISMCRAEKKGYISQSNGYVTQWEEVRTSQSRCKHYTFFTLLVLYALGTCGPYFLFLTFIRIFSFDHFKLSRNIASYINATYMFGLMVSPIVSSSTVLLFSAKFMFFFFAIFQFVTVTVWTLLTRSNLVFHWVLSGLLGVMTLSAYSAIPIYFNSVAESKWFMTFHVCTQGVGDMFFVWLTGRLYDSYGPDVIYAIAQITSTLSALLAIPVFVVARRY